MSTLSSVQRLESLLESDPLLRLQVEAMLAEQCEINIPPGDEQPTILTIPVLLAVLNIITMWTPRFAVNPKDRHFFPMSEIFVTMMYTPTGSLVFRDAVFNTVLRGILQEWRDFLDSPASLSGVTYAEDGWLGPTASQVMDLKEYVIPEPGAEHGGFASFNAYFHREINLADRPLAGPGDPRVVVSANDGTLYRIARGVGKADQFWIKGQPYSLEDMLAGVLTPGCTADDFVGGDVFQAFLSGSDYHRWRAPVSGTIVAQQISEGLMFSELRAEGYDASSGTLSQGYQASVNTRGLTFLRADYAPLKTVCVMPIGITEISSISFNRAVGDAVGKGDELGHFSYGGSTLCLLFQKGAIESFLWPSPPPAVLDPPSVKVRAQIATASG